MPVSLNSTVLSYVEFQMKKEGKYPTWQASIDTISREIVEFAEKIDNVTGLGLRARTLLVSMVKDVARFEGQEFGSRAALWGIGHAAAILVLKKNGTREAKPLLGEDQEIMRLLEKEHVLTPANTERLNKMVRGTLGMYDVELHRSVETDTKDTVHFGEMGN